MLPYFLNESPIDQETLGLICTLQAHMALPPEELICWSVDAVMMERCCVCRRAMEHVWNAFAVMHGYSLETMPMQ